MLRNVSRYCSGIFSRSRKLRHCATISSWLLCITLHSCAPKKKRNKKKTKKKKTSVTLVRKCTGDSCSISSCSYLFLVWSKHAHLTFFLFLLFLFLSLFCFTEVKKRTISCTLRWLSALTHCTLGVCVVVAAVSAPSARKRCVSSCDAVGRRSTGCGQQQHQAKQKGRKKK